MKLLSDALKIVITWTTILVFTLAGVGGYVIRSPMPQVAGTVQAAGLQNEVTIYRDEWGVPHLYGESAHDLFLAQGYVHAQDRFWQMEFWRRVGSGRLSEILGRSAVSTDLAVRTMGWARAAAQDAAALDPETRQALQAYADGVNDYITTHQTLGLEFTLLSAQGVNVTPEPWTITNTLTWLKAMSWDLGGNLSSELSRARLIQTVGVDATLELKPLYPGDHPIIVPSPPAGFDDTALKNTLAALDQLNALTGGGFEGIGSNNWVIAGKLTDTGKPYLANDPHLGIQLPSIWYEIGLHCNRIREVCPFDVVGFSFAGTPGVIIGHNQRIAWGVTNLGPDVQDLYIEKINPDNPNQYEWNGAWVDAQVIPENIVVHGQLPPDPAHPEIPKGTYNEVANSTTLPLKVRVTRHGPLINQVNAAARALSGEYAGVQIPTPSALALHWTAIAEPSLTIRSVLKLNRAKTWDEFREALRDWNVPGQNFVYADIEGNIGYQASGLIPIRRNSDGLLPVPGWTEDYDWQGYIPFEQLPSLSNPPQGYIVTANNAVVDSGYPYLISAEWDKGYRAQRITELIQKAPIPIKMDAVKAQQGDNENLSAREVMPYLTALTFDDAQLRDGVNYLKAWDFQQHMESGPAALYSEFWVRLVSNTFFDELKDQGDLWPDASQVTMLAVRNLLPQPDNHWWDNVTTTDKVETRDDILRQSFKEAYAEAEAQLGDRSGWKWGQLHTATFRNQTLGRSGIPIVEAIFNRGPVGTSGGASVVNATGYRIAKPSDSRTDAKTFEVTSVPSMRMIVDLANFGNSQTMHTTGQSGHPFSAHYDDMIDPWRLIQYHSMLWDRGKIADAARATLKLTP